MKKAILSTLLLASGLFVQAQQTTVTWDYDGTTRKYIQYVPSIYDGSEAVPLVMALHGLGDNVSNFQGVGFQGVADTANFIVVYPEALVDQLLTGSTAWNSGAGALGFYPNSDVDDVGFLNAVMDTLSAHYNIDQSRIYVTGFSMGAFMTNRLACELSDRVAATASVAGTIGSGVTCDPGMVRRVCHFHGTADTQVGYGTPEGAQDNTFGMSVTEWISYWSTNNSCNSVSLLGQFPDTKNDGYTVDYYESDGCASGSRVVHYKVHGADHTWLFGQQNDIDYTREIWKFFLGLSPSNLVSAAGIQEEEIATIGIYPNPATDNLRLENVDAKIERIAIFNTTGQLVKEFSGISQTIDINGLDSGVYQLMVATDKGLFSNSFVKN